MIDTLANSHVKFLTPLLGIVLILPISTIFSTSFTLNSNNRFDLKILSFACYINLNFSRNKTSATQPKVRLCCRFIVTEGELSRTASWLVHMKIKSTYLRETDPEINKTYHHLLKEKRIWSGDDGQQQRKEGAKGLCSPVYVWRNILHKEANYQCKQLRVEDWRNSVSAKSMSVWRSS